MWNDIRFALRTLRRFRPYTLAASLTLALGIGAATAVFSVIDATLLRALPYGDPDRLVALRTELGGPTGTQVLPPSQIELVTWQRDHAVRGHRSRRAPHPGHDRHGRSGSARRERDYQPAVSAARCGAVNRPVVLGG